MPERITFDYRAIVEQSPIGIVVYDRDLRVVECNESFARLIGALRDQIIGLGIDDLRDQRHRAALLKALDGETVTFESPYQATMSETWPWLRATFAPLRDTGDYIIGIIVLVSDRTGEINAATASGGAGDASTQVQLGETQRFGKIGSWTWDAERGVAAGSPEFHRILGLTLDAQTASLGDYELLIHPEDRAQCLAQLVELMARRARAAAGEFRIVRRDNTVRWIAMRLEATYADDGELQSAWGLIQDITERRHLEEQLRQAQKMEAMGQLAAGVAHDFNNLLTVIKVDSELLERGLEERHLLRESVSDIRAAVDRAAGLTKQLLAFSRRQLLRPRLLNINDAIAGATRMLDRLIGEDIELVTSLGPQLPPILADPEQLVQALMNLAVNARDAMPRGGRLEIRTALRVIGDSERDIVLPAGTYVVVEVRDTGHGMDEATRQRIFEPFFTTKPPGHGTGLGLSTVYGIMEQLAGHVTVASEPGRGATFTLNFLPQAVEESTEHRPHHEPARQPEAPSTATVLLVEDESAVRSVCRRVLERDGHNVLVAQDGHDALRVAASFSGSIDLVLTDMVLPTLSGPEVVSRLLAGRPGLGVLYMSGYTSEEIQRRGLVENHAAVLEKPFAVTDLQRAVRDALRA